MTDALKDHQGTVSIGGRAIANLTFADDIDGLTGKEEELASQVGHLEKISAAFCMEITAEKAKLMNSNPNGNNIDIRINGEKLDEVDSFKYLGAESSQIKVLSLKYFVKNCTDNSSTSETSDHLER